MIEQRNSASASCNRQTDGEAAYAQIQIGSRTHMKNHFQLGFHGKAISRRLLLPLACIVTLTAGLNWAAATDQIPYKDAYQAQQLIGGADQVYIGGGTATHLGKFTSVTLVHVGDPAPGSALLPLSGTATATAANGDTLFSSFVGFEDLASAPSGGPLHFFGSQQITGGTGRFTGATGSLTFSGLDFGDGNISVTTEGIISSVGSNK